MENINQKIKIQIKNSEYFFNNSIIHGLIGPSACGKSFLLKEIAATYENASLMFQEGALFDSLTVLENIAFALQDGVFPIQSLPKLERENIEAKAVAILQKVGLGKAFNKLPGELSGGMRRRAALARALVKKSDFLLLDDPTSGLDPVSSAVIMNLIVSIYREYQPLMIIVSHDLRRLLPICNLVTAMFEREIIFQGEVSQIENSNNPELIKFVKCRYDF